MRLMILLTVYSTRRLASAIKASRVRHAYQRRLNKLWEKFSHWLYVVSSILFLTLE